MVVSILIYHVRMGSSLDHYGIIFPPFADISQNIIAMGYPADTIEGLYRNHIDDVVRFFDEKHKDQYMIYNLCAESKRKYNTSKFHGTVVEEYSFQDHNPPPFVILKPFCESLHKWLTSNSKHVAAIHCKAGKGRTGVMICAYLVHVGGCQKSGHYYSIDNADQALDYYGRTRTRDSKGVTIPSQKRYVYYYEDLVKRNLEYRTVRLRFSSLILTSLPNYTVGAYTIICEIYQIPKKKIKTFEIEVKKGAKRLVFNFPEKLYLEGDVKFELFIKKIKNEKLFQFCINTFFVAYGSDTYTVSTTLCPNCNGEKAVLSTKKFSKPICTKFPNYFNDQSVIDISFLDQLREEKLFQDCDCIEPDEVMTNLTAQPTPPAPKPPQAPPPASEESINNKAATTNNRSDSSPMLVFCQPQHSPPLPSLNMSTSASSSSSSSSTQSLCRKASNSDCAFKSTKRFD